MPKASWHLDRRTVLRGAGLAPWVLGEIVGVEISPADAQRLGVAEGDRVRLESPRGRMEARARIREIAQALEDYRLAYQRIAPEVDYVAINISSPNTPGLRKLQAPEFLKPILEGLLELRKELGLERQPLFVKLAPDLPFEELDAIVEAIAASGISGLIATNTTLDRGIVSDRNRARVEAWGDGGLSGAGLYGKARAVRNRILDRLPKALAFQACGGIGTAAQAAEALSDGAALVQVYSALIFEGPGLVGELNRGLAARS